MIIDDKLIKCDFLVFIQTGIFYEAKGIDALILNRLLGYRLHGDKTLKTGFPVRDAETILAKLERFHVDYDLINLGGRVVKSQRFADNKYQEIVDTITNEPKPEPEPQPYPSPKPTPYPTNQTSSEENKVSYYLDIIKGLTEGFNFITGETVHGLNFEARLELFNIYTYLKNITEQKKTISETKKTKPPKANNRWTDDDDFKLLRLHDEGKIVPVIAQILGRSPQAIKLRLLKYGIGVKERNIKLKNY